MAKTAHAQWSSRLTFILAATGSAVGLGNIWKFPYMVGEGGGGAFVLVYLACIAVVGWPILTAEWLVGRRGQKNPVNGMLDVATAQGRSRAWGIFGASGVAGACLILSFYSVIGGWSLAYALSSVTGQYSGADAAGVSALFDGLLASPWRMLGWHTLFMAVTTAIVARGLKGGLEWAARSMMPALALVLLILVGYGMFSGQFAATLAFLFRPDWSVVGADTVLAAMGQAFFSLSVGMGVMLAYGSYLGKDVDLLATARTVIILDTVFALLAGLAIFPIVFSHGLDPGSGPGLIFVTLPLAFGNMTGGLVLSVLFFLLLTFGALTSSISLLEPIAQILEERTRLTRVMATILPVVVIWLLGIAALLSFNHWSGFTVLGNNIFDFLDKLTSRYMLPLTGLGMIVFVGWFMGRESVLRELGLEGAAALAWRISSRWLAPAGVVAIFLHSLDLI